MSDTQMEELRRNVATIIGADPETWPSHGNAPLAIAACVALGRHYSEPAAQSKFTVAQRVRKVTGEYRISGEVRSVFTKADGTVRLVVEHTAEGGGSFLHIYGEANLEAEV